MNVHKNVLSLYKLLNYNIVTRESESIFLIKKANMMSVAKLEEMSMQNVCQSKINWINIFKMITSGWVAKVDFWSVAEET